MKKLVLLGVLILAGIFVFSLVPAQAADAVKLKTCWMPEFETFMPWLAKQKGWDKEEGLDLELIFFESGKAQMEALPAKQWVLGSTGGVPQVVGALRHNAYMIGLGDDESVTNNVYVRPDSPILKAKGFNKEYPDIYGSPETVKGKTILVTTVSSVHYSMSTWLKALGLKDADVVVKQMDQASIVAAFEKGVGDVAVIWAPYCYTAEQKGWKKISDLQMVKAYLPITLVGDKEFCDKNPELVAKFIRIYLRGVNYVKAKGSSPDVVKLYQKFMKDWGGQEMTEEMCKKDIDTHPTWTLEEQLKLFDSSKGESTAAKWQRLIAEFFTTQGRFKPEELEKVNKSGYVTDKFLKLVKTPIPTDK
ncbi:MAG: ABC transporter substrate-binding protein [Deltaproteobacteria bacterium]|nr:ABC transporter substrate-binding protein [Deltaproteobacteria bacterium]